MAEIVFTKKAVEDLSSIWIYTLETWSEKQADLYYRQIVKACRSIVGSENISNQEYQEIHPTLFCKHCNKHLIFYRYIEGGDIEIVRILHERMDIPHNLA